MMTRTESVHTLQPARPLRTVAVVSRDPHQHVFETILGAVDHDVVFVESNTHAYSHIKRVRPDLVIVCLSPDDMDGCQILSMLTLDHDTSRIPVLTYMSSGCTTSQEVASVPDDERLARFVPVWLN